MTGAATIAVLHGGSHAQLATLADPALEPDPPGTCEARLRPDLLARWTDAITDCLSRGATVIVFDENRCGDWLPVSGRIVGRPCSGGAPVRVIDRDCARLTIRRATSSPNAQ